MALETVSVEEILRIHQVLVADFAATGDPIGQMGVRSIALLESAVGRQLAGQGQMLKYADPLGSAATLAFGICCDHPFVNGNKRTSLVALLVHLDKNNLCLHRTSQNDLYQLMLAIADHSIGLRPDPRRRDRPVPRRKADEEVAAVKSWLTDRVERVRRGERVL
ncbi:MAG: Fic family protein, partial [Acidobacteria bacterium]|nr:Fic family protein [Acidobacteriota bacterium]